jgi:hypothetical protein
LLAELAPLALAEHSQLLVRLKLRDDLARPLRVARVQDLDRVLERRLRPATRTPGR